MFSAGFFIWNMDNIFCHHLTSTKKQMLLPWSVILEGHGWWHILTGLGQPPSLFIIFTDGANMVHRRYVIPPLAIVCPGPSR